MLRVHNTLTGSKEPFEPLVPGKVRMYVCGVTVYDYCHIGHARSALVFDVLRRYLEYSGFVVEFAKNFTDVDDKIIKRANEQGVSCEHVTTTYINAYYEDMDKLGVRRATLETRVGDYTMRGIAKRPDQSLADLFAERAALYERYADLTVETTGLTHDAVCKQVEAALAAR